VTNFARIIEKLVLGAWFLEPGLTSSMRRESLSLEPPSQITGVWLGFRASS
jgi:hypothetical protein